MTRIDSATITLSVWDDTLRMRREVTFPVGVHEFITLDGGGNHLYNEAIIRYWWAINDARIRLAAKDGPAEMGPLGV